MAIRTALLNWNNINRDTDFSKYIETVSEPWVIEWLAVSSSSVAVWKARVPCERSNGDKIFALVYVTSAQSISGNGDVYIEVGQTYIDNWELSPEDWTGIATISVGTMPAKNALKLAVKSWTTITDARNMIKTVWELNTQIQSLFADVDDLDERVEALEDKWAIDHLEQSGIVWELYALSNQLYLQNTPSLENSWLDCKVWYENANKEVHIQRIASWTESNKLKLKVKSVWSPTTWLVVEVREWVKVTVTANEEAYWYGWEVIATWSIAYGDITNSYAEKEITLNANFWWHWWDLLDVVVYQTWSTVNTTNYYVIACDSTQYWECFSLVNVNWTTRTRSTDLPYCISDWFTSSALVKVKEDEQAELINTSLNTTHENTWAEYKDYLTYEFNWKGELIIQWSCTSSWNQINNGNINVWAWVRFMVDWNVIFERTGNVAWIVIDIDYLFTTWWTHTIKLQAKWRYTNWSTAYWGFNATVNLTQTVSGSNDCPWRPTSLKNIWDLGIINIFWIQNWEFYKNNFFDWLIKSNGTTTTATTWSISLWNAVWYVVIQIWDNKYKIPYYS